MPGAASPPPKQALTVRACRNLCARFPALPLAEFCQRAEAHSDNEIVMRLPWEIRALHALTYNAWRVEAEHDVVHPNTPRDTAQFAQRATVSRYPSDVTKRRQSSGFVQQPFRKCL